MRAFCLLTVNEFSKPCNNTTPVSSWNAFTTEENISNITSCKKNLQRTSKVAHTLPPPPSQNISNLVDLPSPPPHFSGRHICIFHISVSTRSYFLHTWETLSSPSYCEYRCWKTSWISYFIFSFIISLNRLF